MKSYGIKVSKPGKDVFSASPQDLVFSSKYKTLKIHDRGSGSISSASGGGLVTIPHNLGYVPAFLVHVDKGALGSFAIAPYSEAGWDTEQLLHAYADDTNLYIKATAQVLTVISSMTSGNDMFWDLGGGFNNIFVAGNLSGTSERSAIRFDNVAVAQGTVCSSARVVIYKESTAVSGNIRVTVVGIDEDDTADFGGGSPFGRPTTTASYNHSTNSNLQNVYIGFDVKNIVDEILARGGWSSGNAMAFEFSDNGSDTDCRATDLYDGVSSTDSYLEIILSTVTTADYKYTIFKNQLV